MLIQRMFTASPTSLVASELEEAGHSSELPMFQQQRERSELPRGVTAAWAELGEGGRETSGA